MAVCEACGEETCERCEGCRLAHCTSCLDDEDEGLCMACAEAVAVRRVAVRRATREVEGTP